VVLLVCNQLPWTARPRVHILWYPRSDSNRENFSFWERWLYQFVHEGKLSYGQGGKNRTCSSSIQDSSTTIILHPDYLASPHGLEPRPRVLETRMLPLHYGDINLVDRKRIELLPSTCKADVLPLSLTAQILVVDIGFEPMNRLSRSFVYQTNAISLSANLPYLSTPHRNWTCQPHQTVKLFPQHRPRASAFDVLKYGGSGEIRTHGPR
jgi:hypothetical protein